jgi:hypothetical protein
MADSLPQDVQSLLRDCVESFEHLAVLLLVYRESMRDWSVLELAERLSIPAQLVESAVADLGRTGLVQIASEASPVRYRYLADTAAHAAIAKLAHEYAENPVGVIRLLSANAIERVRTSALQTFADAFVLKKKDQDRG